ncbi:DUF1572 domain-containing protein [Nemorincola caseinilytica]|uniref:DUF1572 domain-containing protein n=1 Tax=Nemorincola caseinilytica TaxID=2054315 RepID=A0ABP8NH67_9BACT
MIKYLDSARRQFAMYKQLGEKAMAQMSDEQLLWQANEDSNSVAAIVKHMWGNMMSRWTDFLTTDGEKPWRQRDAEFDNDLAGREEIMKKWEEGWQCLFDALSIITDNDLDKIIYIRNEGHTILEAVNRQISHYCYHVGQIVYIAKLRSTDSWKSLSIPRNASAQYNAGKFAQDKQVRHFTEDLTDKTDEQK